MWLFALPLLCGAAQSPADGGDARSIRIETQRQRMEDGSSVLALTVNGQTVIRLPRADAPARSLERKLAAAALQLARAYREGRTELAVEQDRDSGDARLLLNGDLLLGISENEATLLGGVARELAELWQRELAAALGHGADAGEQQGGDLTEAAGDGPDPERFSMAQAQHEYEQQNAAQARAGQEREPARPQQAQKQDEQPRDRPAAPPAEGDSAPEAAPKPEPTSTGRVGQGGVQDISLSELSPDPAFQRLMVSLGHRVYEPPLETQFKTVQPPAALVAQVTGPASEDAARIAVEWALRAHTGTPVSSRISWRSPPLSSEQISQLSKARLKELKAAAGDSGSPLRAELPPLATAPGKSQTVRLEYVISSIGEPQNGVADIRIENKSLKLPREMYTWFSNAPEGVKQPQLLYFADMPVGTSGRLVYHHQNQGDQNLHFYARLVNEGSEVGAVHVIPGSCAPDINTYFVGYKSCENFWANLNTGAGYVLRIPPGAQAILCGQALPRGYTSSGYYKLTNLASCNLRIETVVLPAGHWPAEHAYTRTDLASSMVYPEPYYSEARQWQSGDDWLYLRLGQNAPQDLAGRTILHGMYGMTHSYSVEVTNTRETPSTVYVVLRGSAGEVKGQFFINDKYVVSQLVKGGDEQLLEQLALGPGETRRLKIIGIPLNGGFYPASIIIRDTKLP